MTDSLAEALVGATTDVTARWAKQRKAEERDRSAQSRRRQQMVSSRKVTVREAAFNEMPAAFGKASAGGTLPASARQVMYAARPRIQMITGEQLQSKYFTQTLLPDYMNENPEAASWNVVFDARGHFREPHTDTAVDLGTLAVRKYLAGTGGRTKGGMELPSWSTTYPTSGPGDRFGAVLFIEKEGFMPLLEEVQLAERYDLAIMSTKGMSNTASRTLVGNLCERGIPLYVLHDFDTSGFSIIGTLRHSNRRHQFEEGHAAQVIDLGLRLEDVEDNDLEAEATYVRMSPETLRANGATRAEVDFLGESRVELNAFASDELVAWLEAKLDEHGVAKVVPDADTLADAYRRAREIHLLNAEVAKVAAAAKEAAKEAPVPGDLAEQVRRALDEDGLEPWDEVVARLATPRTGAK